MSNHNSECERLFQHPSRGDDSQEDEVAEHSTPLLSPVFPPKENKVVYACFIFLGLGTLLPWNFYITADSYWQYKLRNVTNGYNYSHNSNDTKTELQGLYTPILVSLSQITNFSFLFINAIFSHLIPHKRRLIFSLALMILFFSITAAMVEINSDNWQLEFFIVTMFIVVLFSASGAIFQGGLMGVAGMFPETYICAVGVGQSLGGVFASMSRVISLAIGADNISSTFIYFLVAVAVMLLTLFIYLYVATTSFFQHYYNMRRPEMRKEITIFHGNLQIFKKIWPLGLSICLVFLVTLSVYPVVAVRVISTSTNSVWRDIYFQPVVTFLLFNIGDYVARHLAGIFMWPRIGSKLIYLFTGLRVVFIPLLLMCNHDWNPNIPTVFESDVWYIIIIALFSLSNGYLFSICMMYAPRMVSDEESEKAGTMMAAMIGLGLLLGAALSFSFALTV